MRHTLVAPMTSHQYASINHMTSQYASISHPLLLFRQTVKAEKESGGKCQSAAYDSRFSESLLKG